MIRVGLSLSLSLQGEMSTLVAAHSGLVLEPDLTRADVIVTSAFELDALPRSIPCVVLTDGAMPQNQPAVLPLTARDDQIVAAIYAVAAGLSVTSTMPSELEPSSESLTPRELQVLRLAAAGLANKQIAARLAISEHTVKFHLASLMGKLAAGSRTEAVTTGIRRGLVLL